MPGTMPPFKTTGAVFVCPRFLNGPDNPVRTSILNPATFVLAKKDNYPARIYQLKLKISFGNTCCNISVELISWGLSRRQWRLPRLAAGTGSLYHTGAYALRFFAHGRCKVTGPPGERGGRIPRVLSRL